MSAEPRHDPDRDLVARMQAGDETALAEIVRRHGPRLKALALRFRGSASAADDVVQETFWTAWRKVGSWQPGESPYAAFLTRIAVNRAIDGERRAKLRRFFGIETAGDIAADQTDAEASLAARSELAVVAADIRRLPPRQRAAILLAAGGEEGNAAIGAMLGISEGAAEQLLVRARRTLRERLAGRETRSEKPT